MRINMFYARSVTDKTKRFLESEVPALFPTNLQLELYEAGDLSVIESKHIEKRGYFKGHDVFVMDARDLNDIDREFTYVYKIGKHEVYGYATTIDSDTSTVFVITYPNQLDVTTKLVTHETAHKFLQEYWVVNIPVNDQGHCSNYVDGMKCLMNPPLSPVTVQKIDEIGYRFCDDCLDKIKDGNVKIPIRR